MRREGEGRGVIEKGIKGERKGWHRVANGGGTKDNDHKMLRVLFKVPHT